MMMCDAYAVFGRLLHLTSVRVGWLTVKRMVILAPSGTPSHLRCVLMYPVQLCRLRVVPDTVCRASRSCRYDT